MHKIYGAPEGQDARILAERARAIMPEDRVLVHVAIDDNRVATLQELLHFFADDVDVVALPAWDCLPYDRVSPNSDIVATRVSALTKLMAWEQQKERKPRVLLTTVNAVFQRVMPKDVLAGKSFVVQNGSRLDIAALQEFLTGNGYSRTETVREAGEYAIRGGIIDLFPPGYELPARIDLFGDEIDSVRQFDPISQRTKKKIRGFTLQPVTEYFLDEESVARFRSGYREAFGVVRDNDPLYEAISEGRRYNGVEHWLPLFYERMDTVFDYAPGAEVIFDAGGPQAHDERALQINDFFDARETLKQSLLTQTKKTRDISLSGSIYHPLPVRALYMEDAEWTERTHGASVLSSFADPRNEQVGAKKGRDFADIRALPDGDVFGAVKSYFGGFAQKKLVACYSDGSLSRVQGLFKNAGIADVEFVVLTLENGFVSDDLVVVTEQDILGDRLARQSKKSRKADNFLTEISSLGEGDLVVHVDHGVGRFLKLETLNVGKTLHDCLQIEYHGGDKLYVPVENIEVLSRFGSDEIGAVQLDKMGGAGWQARKAKVKKDLMIMADKLLKIAAARQLNKAEPLQVSAEIYNEFAARFPYQETEDQHRAIESTLESMAANHPMDRLVCGDVGFGKTEVAIRAAYVAVMAGSQVALAVPTTLLARQHYQNFMKRFEGTGIRIEQLSRMVTQTEATKIKERLKTGESHIVIGTHALFGKEVNFSNLGLLIVDEEQRFGVKQKERLKELRANVHVLTLTATPIPRTLQMALTEVKEMSLMATPPVDRLAVRTFVLPFDGVVIREALLREHYRGGQSFYVAPRIADLEEIEETLKELVPEVKVVAAHGQMSANDLEERMSAFYDGQYDVLLATNIIESGIDIPSANTMIIHRADMFGLAQLYQIRGRIGRSKVRAYAYLTYQPDKALNPQAMKRLEVMETLDTLGSGFQLASHDMDIRGAGNLLGDQQSGHIKEIGVELYQQMLEEAVAAAREGLDFGEMPEQKWSPQINLGTSVLIPETYVEDLGVRMSLYRRLADLEEGDDVESFAAELIDRFGELPKEVENLLDIVTIKQLCRQAGVGSVEAGPKGAVIGFHNDSPPDVAQLMGWIAGRSGTVKLRPDQKLVAMRHWDTPERRVQGVKSLMKELAGL